MPALGQVSDLPANQQPIDFYNHPPYQKSIARPAERFGYEPGEFQTTYAQFQSLLESYQRSSNRLQVFEIGKTPEHRTLYLLAISSPKNISRLNEIKSHVAELADPRRAMDQSELDALIQETPIVIWLSYSIHGDESAAFEAAIDVIYQLLASDDSAIQNVLDQAVILVNPCQNPDGHERFATWYNTFGASRPEHFAFEHKEPWNVSGRLNHNFFDLNRDLISISQPESLAATQAFLEWHPQVLADHHGETPEYFFPPVSAPINPNLPYRLVDKWNQIFGSANAQTFDQNRWSYFVRDVFDLFYPGYWDSWSSFHGATGMTFETDGGGRRGYAWYRDDHTIVTLKDGIVKHVAAALTTIATAAKHREQRLRDYRIFFEDTKTARREYILVPGPDVQLASDLVAVLLKQGISIDRTKERSTLPKGKDRFGTDVQEVAIPAGSFVINAAQPLGHLVDALLQPDTAQDPEFLERERKKRQTNEKLGQEESKEEFDFYDVTAWSLPLTYGVDAYFTEQPISAETEPLHSIPSPSATSFDNEGLEASSSTPKVAGTPVAYLFQPDSIGAMELAGTLLQQGYRVATSRSAFGAGQQRFLRGSFILKTERNPKNLPDKLYPLARKFGTKIVSSSSEFTAQGNAGIGSETVFALSQPKIALLAGEPVSQTSFGLVQFLLKDQAGFDFVPVPSEILEEPDLNQFNVLILPDGSVKNYKRIISGKSINQLREWISNGGVLICLKGASAFAADPEVKLTTSRVIGKPADEKPSASPTSEESGPLEVPGSIFRATLGSTNFLATGYDQPTIPIQVEGKSFFKSSDTGANVLSFIGEKLRVSGYTWTDDTEDLLRGSVALIDEPTGQGHVVLFAFEPGFRIYWESTIRLLWNAIIYGPSEHPPVDD